MDFYIPNYLESDFDSFLQDGGESCTLNYNTTTPTTFYGLITSLDFKSNMKGLSDTTMQLQCSRSLNIKKGDYVTDSNSNIYLVNWHPYKSVNSYTTQIQLCTNAFTIERFLSTVLDSYGNVCTPNSYETIASYRGYISRIGSGFWDSRDGDVGIVPLQRISVAIQYDLTTSNIQISDEFSYNGSQYIITDIDYAQLNPSGDDGVLILYAQVLDGGRRA